MYAHRLYSLKAQHMLNKPVVQRELIKEASRRRVETIRSLYQEKVLQGGYDPNKLGEDGLPTEPEDKLIKTYVKGGQEVISLSVFTRPYRATRAEDSFTNKEIDDTYKSFSLGKTEGLFNPKLALENRK